MRKIDKIIVHCDFQDDARSLPPVSPLALTCKKRGSCFVRASLLLHLRKAHSSPTQTTASPSGGCAALCLLHKKGLSCVK